MLCLVVTNMLEVDMGMFGAEAAAPREMQVHQLKGLWAGNGGVGPWGRGRMGGHPPFPAKKPREGTFPLQHRDRDGDKDRDRHGWE